MRFRRIVIAVDFSDASLTATRWVARHFGAGAELVLAHVIDIPQPPAFLRGKLPPHAELLSTTQLGAEQRIVELAFSLEAEGAGSVRPEVRVGHAAQQILELVEESGADLIAVGGHGRRRGLWGMLGSTAERLLESATVPVLLAAHLPEGAPTRLLAPVDASELSRHVLVTADAVARGFGAELIALHVFDPLTYGRVRLVASPGGGSGGELRLGAEQWLEERIAELELDREKTRACVALGVPGYEILSAASREGVDLIVMGSRGGQPIGRVLLGSVARSVVRGASCPVLVLRNG
jgi:nucleotide-binding universal stress UspA family protein